MKRILLGLIFSLVSVTQSIAQPSPTPIPQRQLKICVSRAAPAELKAAANRVLAAMQTNPLLREMGREQAPRGLTDTSELAAASPVDRAYSHLVIIGLPDDPLVKAAWQREARVLPGGGWYAFGYGNFTGDIGWIESDRNPFLHGAAIARAPFETHVVTLSGNTPVGVLFAVDAFLRGRLLNGLVAAPGWKRGPVTLLDHDPIVPSPASIPPVTVPESAGGRVLLGWIQPNEEEFRGVEDDAGVAPLEVARFKYARAADWDFAGSKYARTAYHLGLHRRSYGNLLWAAKFSSVAEASASAGRIAGAAKLTQTGRGLWTGAAAAHSDDKDEPTSPLALWTQDEWVWMSTLPADTVAGLRSGIARH